MVADLWRSLVSLLGICIILPDFSVDGYLLPHVEYYSYVQNVEIWLFFVMTWMFTFFAEYYASVSSSI